MPFYYDESHHYTISFEALNMKVRTLDMFFKKLQTLFKEHGDTKHPDSTSQVKQFITTQKNSTIKEKTSCEINKDTLKAVKRR